MTIGNQFDPYATQHYTPDDGYFHSAALPLNSWIWNDNGTLKAQAIAAGGTVGFAYASTSLVCVKWGATADATQKLGRNVTVPQDYRRDVGRTGKKSQLIVRFKVRKLDAGGATDNTDLALLCQCAMHNPAITDAGVESDGDTSVGTLSTVATAATLAGALVLPAMAVAASEEKFRVMQFNLSNAMSATQLAALVPGASLTLSIYPNEAVGTSLAVEVMDIELIYSGHLVPANKALKQSTLG